MDGLFSIAFCAVGAASLLLTLFGYEIMEHLLEKDFETALILLAGLPR